MRSFRFALRIAGFFAVVMAVVLVGSFGLFARVAGHDLLREVGRLRAHEGVAAAERIEAVIDTAPLQGPEVAEILRAESEPVGTEMKLLPPDAQPPEVHKHHALEMSAIAVRGRRCVVFGPPVFETRVPVLKEGRTVALVAVRGHLHDPQAHGEFLLGTLEIGALALAGIVSLSLYLAAPLRRMARSMDRIAAGELEHRVVVKGRDEVARIGESFNAMAERIQALLTGQKELMAGVSHELRSPLARIKMNLELVRERGADARRLDELEDEIDGLNELVDELLVASRLELGETKVEVTRLILGEVVDAAWRRIENEAAGRQLILDIDAETERFELNGDRSLLTRVLGNLFENSLRYAGGGRVSVRAHLIGDSCEIEVVDDGPGVADDQIDRLFEPFFRGDASRSCKTGASGLGLMIVRRAVEAHGGAVRAGCPPGRGLRIVITLPK